MALREEGSRPTGSSRLQNCASLKNSVLLRGLPLEIAMRRFGVLFSTTSAPPTPTSDPSAESVKAEHGKLRDFISHNWVTSRTEKFLCLAVHYNLTAAVCACWGVAALFCVLTALDVLPFFEPPNSPPTCHSSMVSGGVTFFVVLFGAQDFRRLLHRIGLAEQGPLVFVDKACINQLDPELKREGIENLAGFLLASQNIVIVYGPDYLYKLWTVYELATFVMAHEDHTRIKVIPTMWLRQLGAMVIGLDLALVVFYVLLYTWHVVALVAYISGAVFFSTVVGYFIRQWQRQREDITAAIKAFSIRKTNCAVESDRIQVQDNVRIFLHCLGRVSAETGQGDDALDEFDKLVREVLPQALESSIGSRGIPYSHLIACASIFMCLAMDNGVARFQAGWPWSGVIAAIVFHVSDCLVLVPLGFFVVQKILVRRLHLRGCAECLYTAAALVPSLVLYLIAHALQFMATQRAQQHDVWAWAYCAALLVYCALAAALTVAAFRPRCRGKVTNTNTNKNNSHRPTGTSTSVSTSTSMSTSTGGTSAQSMSTSSGAAVDPAAGAAGVADAEVVPSQWRHRCDDADCDEIAEGVASGSELSI